MTTWSVFAFDDQLNPTRLAADCAGWGLDSVILAPPHAKQPRFPAELRAHGLGLWLNLPVFYAPAFLQQHPEHYAVTWRGERAIQDWLHMGCPTDEAFLDARAQEFTALLRQVEPVTLSLDFIRWYVRWETIPRDADPASVVDGCYCPRCLDAFARSAGEPARRDADGRLVPEQWPAWADWRTGRISEVAARFAALARAGAPGVPLHVKTVPWGPDELDDGLRRIAGQDLEALARLADHVVPMAFTHLLGRDPAWKRDLLADVRRRTGKETLSYVQIQAIEGGTIPPAQLEAELDTARAEGLDVVVFSYEQLAADPARAQTLQRHIRAGRG